MVQCRRVTKEKGEIDTKRRTKRNVRSREREVEMRRGRDANSRPGEIKMSRVYPGTNTPCWRIRAAAGTGEQIGRAHV